MFGHNVQPLLWDEAQMSLHMRQVLRAFVGNDRAKTERLASYIIRTMDSR